MGGAKPCLGYPSRTAAVIGLRSQGLTTRAIAEAIGISVTTVCALECSGARQSRIREELPGQAVGRGVTIAIDILNALGPHAARRGIHVNSLVRRIVEIVVDDNMVDAILDDMDALTGGPRP